MCDPVSDSEDAPFSSEMKLARSPTQTKSVILEKKNEGENRGVIMDDGDIIEQ